MRTARVRGTSGMSGATLPARLARLASVSAIVIAVAAPRTTLEAAARAAATLGLGTRFVYRQRSPAHLFAVEGGNGCFRRTVVRHLHESETPRASGVAIRNHGCAVHGPVWLKPSTQLCFGRAESKISDENLLHATPSDPSEMSVTNLAWLVATCRCGSQSGASGSPGPRPFPAIRDTALVETKCPVCRTWLPLGRSAWHILQAAGPRCWICWECWSSPYPHHALLP